MGCPLASLTTPCSTELAADALATKSMTPIKPIQIDLMNIIRKRVATWQTHNIQFANFDVASLAVIWFCSDALLGCLLGQHLMLRKHSPGAKVVSENEWRNLWTHRLSGPKAAPAAFSHVVRNGAAGSRVVRATSSTTVPSNTRRT